MISTKLTVFENVRNTNPERDIGLEDFVRSLESNESKEMIQPLRLCIEKEGPDSKLYALKKKSLPAVTLAGTFGNGRKDEDLVNYSGIIHLDLDKLPLEKISKYKEILKQDPFVLLCFISPSGRGLKIGGLHGQGSKKHQDAYFTFKTHIQQLLECEDIFDDTVRNLARICFYSYDPDVYFNQNCQRIHPVEQIQQFTDKKINYNNNLNPNNVLQLPGANQTLQQAVYKIKTAKRGEKHNTRLAQSRLIGGYVAAGALDEGQALEDLEKAACLNTDNESSALKDIKDGFVNGKQSPIHPYPPDTAFGADLDISAVLGDALPTLPRGILDTHLEEYLELIAEDLELNYEAAFCELLINTSIAIGGNKQLEVGHEHEEKALLWLAAIGKSGTGKTPLNRKCGGALLEQQQKDWANQYRDDLEVSQREENQGVPRLVRRRWIANSLTLEMLCSLHEENPAGIGITSDEIMGVLDGLNQYKGKGNDRQKLLSLWNGNAFENPTTTSDRYIPSVFVPIAGGIQEAIVRKIINDVNTADGLAARFLFNYLVISKEPLSLDRKDEVQALLSKSLGNAVLKQIFDKLVAIRDIPRQVQMNLDAKKLLQNLERQLNIEGRRGSDDRFAAYKKLGQYIYRVALTLHYLIEDKPDEKPLSMKTAKHTVAVMEYFTGTMKRAYGTVELTDKERKARAILDKVQQLGDGSLIRDIKQLLKKSIRSDEFEVICNILEEAGELLRTPKGKTFTLSLSKSGSQILS